jgi:hypothetical protein
MLLHKCYVFGDTSMAAVTVTVLEMRLPTPLPLLQEEGTNEGLLVGAVRHLQ